MPKKIIITIGIVVMAISAGSVGAYYFYLLPNQKEAAKLEFKQCLEETENIYNTSFKKTKEAGETCKKYGTLEDCAPALVKEFRDAEAKQKEDKENCSLIFNKS